MTPRVNDPAPGYDFIKRKRGRPKKGEEPVGPKWTTKLSNKGYDPCPRCQFPEAYGGYCPECGWMEAIKINKTR